MTVFDLIEYLHDIDGDLEVVVRPKHGFEEFIIDGFQYGDAFMYGGEKVCLLIKPLYED